MSSPNSNPDASAQKPNGQQPEILPTLFGSGYGNYQIRTTNFIYSFVLHMLLLGLILWSTWWISQHKQQIQMTVTQVFAPGTSEYVLPPAPDKAGGGGGGGDRDKLAAPKGALPKQSLRDQITPPQVVIRNNNPKLPVEASVVVPPSISLPHSGNMGDPLSAILGPPSNGQGFGGGIGNGSGGGVGTGRGPGVGPGYGGGIGGGLFRVGGGVSAPKKIYDPEPEYSEEARKAKYQGVVVLWVVIGPDGRTHDIKVQRSLGMGLDEKAVEAVKQWKFEPAKKDGQPVAVQVNIEVNFRLY